MQIEKSHLNKITKQVISLGRNQQNQVTDMLRGQCRMQKMGLAIENVSRLFGEEEGTAKCDPTVVSVMQNPLSQLSRLAEKAFL